MLDEPLEPMLPLELLVDGTHLRLFTMFATSGTSQDISLQELRIDMSFPVDELTRLFLLGAVKGIAKGTQDAVGEEKAVERRDVS